ncbi:hypothetical protein KCU85_g8950, partial [Aureobasidium melanogenum]
MADQSTTDLKYGHFGQIIYNPDDQVWLFPRILESSPTLLPLGTSQLVFKSQHSQARIDPVTTEKPSVHLNRQLSELLRFDPTTAPSAHILAEPAVVSQEIQKTVLRHDPTTGHLLAFGRVPDHTIKRSTPIVAFPAADHAHILRLVQIQPQKHGWERNKSVWIDVPRLSGESGTWHAPHPIRQICFADTDEDSNLARTLAVRTTIAVHVLRIAARKHASSWNSLAGTPSRFHTEQLCTLSLNLFGGLAPAHVAFNHWYPKQFVTVDQYGTWHVWDSSLRQIPSEHGKPIELCRGATNDQVIPDHETTASLLDDGWGRAMWAGNVQTIVTASRRCLGIYDIQGKPVRLQSPNLGLDGTPHWILDIMLNPLDPTLIFVLTSTSLFCLRVRCLDEFNPESYDTAGAEVVLQCRHFRDSEDTGLGLSNFVDDMDVVVLIKSSLSPLATSHRFAADESSPQFLRIADATQLVLPELPSTATASPAALTFQIQPVQYGESGHHEQPSGPGKTYQDSSTVPGRVRLVKEQLARRIAAEICLASHVIRQTPVRPSEEETAAETQATEDDVSSQTNFPQSSLPTPSPTATPSLTTVTSLSSHPSTLVSSEFARLRRYTTFSSEKPTPAPLPKGLTNTLAHWTLDGNPDDYDWLAVQREQEKKAEEEDEDLTPKERARLKRRAERMLLKQRRESQKASAMDFASSQVPGIVSASQPAFATPSRSEAPKVPQSARAASQGTQLLASSQAQPNMFTSQVQPGRFGGKPAKKKRKVGF